MQIPNTVDILGIGIKIAFCIVILKQVVLNVYFKMFFMFKHSLPNSAYKRTLNPGKHVLFSSAKLFYSLLLARAFLF